MNDKDRQLVSAYVDGELPSVEHAAVEQRLSEEPALRALLGKYRQLDEVLHSTFDSINDEAPSPALQATLDTLNASVEASVQSNVIKLDNNRAKWIQGYNWRIAASVLLALCVLYWIPSGMDAPTTGPQSLLAGLGIDQARFTSSLESTQSQQQVTLGGNNSLFLTPVSSYRTKSDQFCREFKLSSASQHYQGIACRNNENWQPEIIVKGKPTAASYEVASAENLEAMDSFIDSTIEGIPFGADEEHKLILNRWVLNHREQ